jgi:hypothetical protein
MMFMGKCSRMKMTGLTESERLEKAEADRVQKKKEEAERKAKVIEALLMALRSRAHRSS